MPTHAQGIIFKLKRVGSKLRADHPNRGHFCTPVHSKVPKAFTAHLHEHFVCRPPAYYFEDAIAKQRRFGTRRDIDGSLEKIVGYLDDAQRKRISASSWPAPPIRYRS